MVIRVLCISLMRSWAWIVAIYYPRGHAASISSGTMSFSFITIETFRCVRSPSLKTARVPQWELSTQIFHTVWYTYQFFRHYLVGFRNHFLKKIIFWNLTILARADLLLHYTFLAPTSWVTQRSSSVFPSGSKPENTLESKHLYSLSEIRVTNAAEQFRTQVIHAFWHCWWLRHP